MRHWLAAAIVVSACSLGIGTAAQAATGPTLNYACSPPNPPTEANCAGWHTAPVTISWDWDQITAAQVAGTDCDTHTFSSDTAGLTVTCGVYDKTTLVETVIPVVLKVDRTPPVVTAAVPDRPPDYAGWWNHPVSFAWQGSDATSGIASCDTIIYSGPDNQAANLSGGCRDVAGNSATLPFSLPYDATPPSLTAVTPLAGDRQVVLRWTASPDTVLIEVLRSPGLAGASSSKVYSGTGNSFVDKSVANGRDYRYTVTAYDVAANSSSSTVSTVPSLALRPANGARLRGAALLRWPRVKRARYYNVQLFRGKRKILSAWPSRARFKLHASWMFGGKRRHLSRGRYHWYVWPGFGSRAAHRYGALIGHSNFSIVA